MIESRTESSQTITFKKGDLELAYETKGWSDSTVIVSGVDADYNINPNVTNTLNIDIVPELAKAFESLCGEER